MLRWFCFFGFLFLLATCVGDSRLLSQNSQGKPEVVSIVKDEEGNKVVEYDEDESDRGRVRQERERLKSKIIFSTVDDRFGSTGRDYGDYDSDDCDEFPHCKEICNKTTRRKTQCYKQPRDLVEDIQDGLFELTQISDVDDVKMSPSLLQGILDIDKELLEDLVDDHMSEGDIKSFLTWVAINKSIATVLEKKDSKHTIVEKALEELGRFQVGSKRDAESGLSTGLIGRDDTFLALAADESNSYAFKIGYEILEDSCRDIVCKLRLLCARERRRSSRGRSLGLDLGCRTPTNSRQRSRRDRVCYVHGGGVWSYLYELIDDKEIRDSDFKINEDDPKDGPIGVERCNKVCGSKSNKNCSIID